MWGGYQNTGGGFYNWDFRYQKQISDVSKTLTMLKTKFGLTEPSFEECACYSPIENLWLFAARCRSILKNGPPQQFSDFIQPWDER